MTWSDLVGFVYVFGNFKNKSYVAMQKLSQSTAPFCLNLLYNAFKKRWRRKVEVLHKGQKKTTDRMGEFALHQFLFVLQKYLSSQVVYKCKRLYQNLSDQELPIYKGAAVLLWRPSKIW